MPSGNPVLRSADFILSEALQKSGEPVDGTSEYFIDGQAQGFINDAHLACLAGGNDFIPEMEKPWTWAMERLPYNLILQPPFETGGVTVTAGSAAITFDTPPAFSLVNYMFRVDGISEWFRIIAHNASSGSATIDAPYTDVSISGSAFLCALFEYDISPTNGVLRLVEPFVVYRQQDLFGDDQAKIYSSSEDAMLKEWPLTRVLARVPTKYSIIKKTNGIFTVRFNSYVTEQAKVEVKYIAIPDYLTFNIPQFQATVTIAVPGVWSAVNHQLVAGNQVKLSTTGALPSPLIPGTNYFVVNPTTNSFQLSATLSGSPITTTGTQSGNHTVIPQLTPAYPLLPVEHRITMTYMVAYWLCEDKNDDRAQLYFGLAKAAAKAMINADNAERVQSSKGFGQLIPRRDSWVRGRRYVSQDST